ncbi:MAG: right-handed parallel beta-helix repeat-containing protein, partial [Bacteroidales bacterium]|nr:right-handed parallel beta-helix repeat-containing protein [Bacteroidales bacterium]
RIEAVGNAGDSILFTAQTPALGWGGLRFINNDSNGQGSSKIAFCRIEYGRASGSPSEYNGGAVYCYKSSQLLIDHSRLVLNYASESGGAVYCEDSDIEINKTLIAGNEADNDGGGIYCNNSDLVLTNNTFYENIAGSSGGAIYAGLLWPTSSPVVTNCILWNDNPNEITSSGSITVSYSDVEGGYSGITNISQDPLFVDPPSEDFNLNPCSPCIDAGDPASPVDPDGTPVDMGAFYFNQLSGTIIYGGNVSGTWTNTAGPYFVCSDITISYTGLLTIEPGTEVIFMGQNEFVVNGRIIAEGTMSDSIIFTADQPASGWRGFRFEQTNTNGQDSSRFEYCRVEYGKPTGSYPDNAGGAFYCDNSSKLSLRNSTIRYNSATYGGGIFLTTSSPFVRDCQIISNTGEGIQARNSSSPIILGNLIEMNSSHGIRITTSDAMPVVTGNMINNNQNYPVNAFSSHLSGFSGNSFSGNNPGQFYITGNTVEMDGTWEDPDIPIRLYGTTYIQGTDGTDGVTVIVLSPGMEFLMQSQAAISVGHASNASYPGGMIATGAVNDSIVFTAGSATPSPGYWQGIIFEYYASDSDCLMDYCVVEYGGYGAIKNIYCTATHISLSNSSIRYGSGSGVYLYNGSDATITNCRIYNNSVYGLYMNIASADVSGCETNYNQASGVYVSSATSNFIFNNCQASNNGAYGLYISIADSVEINNTDFEFNGNGGIYFGSSTTVVFATNNQVNNNGIYPVVIYANQVGGLSGNSYSDNGNQMIYTMGATISEDATWEDPGIPYLITTDINVQGMDGPDEVTVLELSQGTELRMESQSGFRIGHSSNASYPGGLIAIGTVSDSIYFTANTATPSPGYWDGITFENYADDSKCMMDFCVVEYGGYSTFMNILCDYSSPVFSNCSSRYGSGNGIHLNQSDAQVLDSKIYSNTNSGIYCVNSSPVITATEVGYNASFGIYIIQSSSPAVSDCHIHNNSSFGIYSTSLVPITVTNCDIEYNGTYGLYITTATSGISISGNNIDFNSGYPVRLYASQVGGLTSNTYAGNNVQQIFVNGNTVTEDAIWDNPGIPYFISNGISIQGTDGLNGVTTLTIEPGSELRFASGVQLYIGHNSSTSYPGGLIAAGTVTEPIKFTANTTSPGSGYWSGMYFANYSVDSLSILDHCIVEYGGYSANHNIICYYSAPTITNCTLQFSGNFGISYEYCSDPVIDHCLILNNLSAGISCFWSPQLSITNNTICGNFEGIRVYGGSDPGIINNILYDNYMPINPSGGGFQLTQVCYNDIWVYDTINTVDFPLGFGTLATQNINGNPCDPYFNIFLDPMFEDASNDNYRITMYSPCINAGDPNLPYDPDNTISDIGAYYYTLVGEPTLSSIIDIPNDQGKQVAVTWQKSPLDAIGSPAPVSFYSLWRFDDFAENQENTIMITDLLEIEEIIQQNNQVVKETIVWENGEQFMTYITQIPAIGFNEYTVVAPTLFDSCEISINYTTYQVLAHMNTPQIYYASLPDSGYSVDNLAPHVPENFTGEFVNAQVELDWSPVPDEDFQYFALYRSDDSLTFPLEPFAATIDTIFTD